jgi:2-succinyl-6-hydroxy-2,4-cyclohexadiene-1-carboxylate synthase
VPAERLAAHRHGHGRRLVLVHGFTQTGRSWAPLAEHLATRHDIVAVDAPGHGGSATIEVDLVTGAALLGATGGRATYIGYSMGGRLCLHLAIGHPQLVERLVLISATAGIDDAGERAARRRSDEALATSLERAGLDAFLAGWVAQPLFAGLVEPGLDDRRRNTVAGLASSLRLAGTGTQQPLWERLASFDAPVLLVAGRRDGKFVAAAERMAALFPHATVALVDSAGHTVHLEQPGEFRTLLDEWLAATDADIPSA